MIENLYLLYSYYGVEKCDEKSVLLFKVARKSYKDFCRRISFHSQVSVEQRRNIEQSIEEMLAVKLPCLIDSDNQKMFDEKHYKLCVDIMEIYNNDGEQAYGVAQRWVNLTLLNLTVIEEILHTGYWNITECRNFFHVPVEQYLLEVATSKISDRFKHGLHLKMAPLKNSSTKQILMDWYTPGETKPFENWCHKEYIEFQKAVRKKIEESFSDRYGDCLDWAFHAFLEGVQFRNIY